MKNTKQFKVKSITTNYTNIGDGNILITVTSKIKADIETARSVMQELTGNVIEIAYNDVWISRRGHVMGGDFTFSTVTQ